MTYAIIALAGAVVLLLSMVFKRDAKIHELEAQLDHAKAQMTGVTNAIKKTKQVEAEAEKPAPVPPADAGDDASRLDRLSKL